MFNIHKKQERINAEQLAMIQQTRQLFAGVFNTPDGKKVIKHLRRLVNAQNTPFVSGKTDETAFNCGAQFVVNYCQFYAADAKEGGE